MLSERLYCLIIINMGKIKYYTEEGLNALKEELESINVFDSKKISQQIAEARDKGDLSENAGI